MSTTESKKLPGEPSAKKIKLFLDRKNGDRYCCHCGYIIKGYALEQLDKCPYRNCGKFLPFRSEYSAWGNYENIPWSTCQNRSCDSYICDSMKFCKDCGVLNIAAVRRQARIDMAQLQSAAKQKDQKIRALEAEAEKLKAELQKVTKMNSDLEETVLAQECELFSDKLPSLDDGSTVAGGDSKMD